MSKSAEEVRRAAFEHAYSKLDQQAAQHLLFVRDDGQYGYHTTRTAWGCFNAALDAVVIELPGSFWPAESLNPCIEVPDILEAIESTNLGLKII
jgi:hypothetical protein